MSLLAYLAYLAVCWSCDERWMCPDEGLLCPECGMHPDDDPRRD